MPCWVEDEVREEVVLVMCSVFVGLRVRNCQLETHGGNKGRGVFKGCDVEDEDGAVAMFMNCPVARLPWMLARLVMPMA